MAILIAASATAAERRLPRGTPSPRMKETLETSIKPDGKRSSGAEWTVEWKSYWQHDFSSGKKKHVHQALLNEEMSS